ncbi:hypothetical protein T440DRAFT_400677 [Plenodomus tracheiphilus IPT5]|uniref:Phytanoyl-CoA dioxygenase family protein n=1 Tax=Plenodomus tracheiphilus IPT5 TaxID=1408161 RepID=A0A6A7B370_9PLEO|nr:hypothetical protein T440DRAFT_400677 [Plenodomus tracheiphilus IPT5]
MAPGLNLDGVTIFASHIAPRQQKSSTTSFTPKIADLDCASYTEEHDLITDIIAGLRLSGGCLVRNMYSRSTLDAMETEIRPYIQLTSKATTKREDFVPRLTNSWHGNEARTSISKPQLSTTVTFSVGPGTKAQGLHRDDDIYHTQHPAAQSHHLGRDTMLCLFVAGKPCTQQNGATRIVPGSHLWDYMQPPPSYEASPDMFAHAEMLPGDAFFMLGGCYHGAGENTTTNEERLVYAAFSTRGYLRQEENQYLANELNKIRELPLELQGFAGFGTSKPYMGWVDMEEPVKLLNPELENEDAQFW